MVFYYANMNVLYAYIKINHDSQINVASPWCSFYGKTVLVPKVMKTASRTCVIVML